AVVEKARYAAMPAIPTIGETVPGFEMSSWVAFFAPAGTPAPLLARLNEAMVKVLTTDAVKESRARSCGRTEHAGRACRHRQGRSRRARPAGECRQYPRRIAGGRGHAANTR